MATRTSLLAFSALLALVVPAAAQEQQPPSERYHLRLEYLWWSPQPAGQLQKGFSDREGSLVDVQTDLGLQQSSANTLRGALRLGTSWKLRGSWAAIDFRGDVTAAKGFEYGTAVVRSGDEVRASIKGNYGTAELEWDFLKRPQGFAGLLLGAKIFDIDTLLLNVDTEDRVAETQRLPIPVVGLAGRMYFGRHFSMEGEVSGLTIGDRGHVWEWTIAARVHLTDRLAGTGGYHRLALEGRDERDYLKLDLGQWTYGVEISL
jgi:hypothetical protein